MTFIKTMTIDGFYTRDEATSLIDIVKPLPYTATEFGYEIREFNAVPPDADDLFSSVLGTRVSIDLDRSGVFRIPKLFIHFEDFQELNEWIFVVALENSTFNLFEHHTAAISALDAYEFGYRNLFEWDLTVNYVLKPGQGIFFRPWLFHSFDSGLIQIFRLKEL